MLIFTLTITLSMTLAFSLPEQANSKAKEMMVVSIPILHVESKLDSQEAVIIHLMEKIDNAGYDVYTNLYYDKNRNIQKAFIKIFNVDELNKNQLEVIIRHELGHALGLGHTNEKNDLMQPIIDMKHATISLLDLQTLARIY